MTSQVKVTAHPGSGVNHVVVNTFDDEGNITKTERVLRNETKDFIVHDNHNLEIYEDFDEEIENA